MPAFSYKERFVPMVIDGSKPQTIRKRRKKGFAKKGDQLYHYFGMRTKFCRKLRQDLCTDVVSVLFSKSVTCPMRVFVFPVRLNKVQADLLSKHPVKYTELFRGFELKGKALNRFAWLDGFRPENSTLNKPGKSFELMDRWWTTTHEFPFVGDLIKWKP